MVSAAAEGVVQVSPRFFRNGLYSEDDFFIEIIDVSLDDGIRSFRSSVYFFGFGHHLLIVRSPMVMVKFPFGFASRIGLCVPGRRSSLETSSSLSSVSPWRFT